MCDRGPQLGPTMIKLHAEYRGQALYSRVEHPRQGRSVVHGCTAEFVFVNTVIFVYERVAHGSQFAPWQVRGTAMEIIR